MAANIQAYLETIRTTLEDRSIMICLAGPITGLQGPSKCLARGYGLVSND